jgi:hypothetical protein
VNLNLGEKHSILIGVDPGPQCPENIVGYEKRCLAVNNTDLDSPFGQGDQESILANYRAAVSKSEDGVTGDPLRLIGNIFWQALHEVRHLLLSNDGLTGT